MKPERQLP